MHLVILNLPKDAGEAMVRELLSQCSVVDSVCIEPDHGLSMAIVGVQASHEGAQRIAQRLQGKPFHGHLLGAWVTSMPWADRP